MQSKQQLTDWKTGIMHVPGLREALLLIFFALALFFLISFVTFGLDDNGWRQIGAGEAIANSGGRVGAWLADFCLSIFGVMAYLFPVILGYTGILIYSTNQPDNRNSWLLVIRCLGFVITLVSGAAIAYLHFLALRLVLPETSGGILGEVIGETAVESFGLTGGSLFLLAAVLAGITLFTGLSWLGIMDFLGKYALIGIDRGYRFISGFIGSYQDTSDARRDADQPVIVHKRKKKNKTVKKVEPRFEPNSNLVPPPKKENPPKKRKITVTEKLPPLDLLNESQERIRGYSKSKLEEMSTQVESILAEFGVVVEVVEVHPGPVITRFEIQPAAGVKVSKISGLAKDLARALLVSSVRIVEIIPGKSVIGLEIPNDEREMVTLHEMVASANYVNSSSPMTLVLGKDISGKPVVSNLAKMPHLLVAGTTGSGKSVAVNAMILSLLYKSTPDEVRLIMIDPKMLELSVYEGIPHLLTPVVIDMKEAANALRWCVGEMERRYRLMSMLGVRNLAGFNQKVKEAVANGSPIKDPLFTVDTLLPEDQTPPDLTPLPNIVIVIDELADMMMIVGKKVEELIARLAQKARAAGLHLILATQRPSVDVITGLIKANIPTRIAFQVSSKIDSRTVIDQGGAETLLGNGDMLFVPAGTSIPVRVHGAFVDDVEVHRVVDYLKQTGPVDYLTDITREQSDGSDGSMVSGDSDGEGDPLYDQAVQIVTESRRASISNVQRRLKVGYNRAARMIEEMEIAGVVSPAETNGSREVLAPPPPED